MKVFIHDNFLLQNQYAEILYHQYAEHLPIIDYHNHLPPKEVAENRQFETITQVWLEGDHYKWRAMRANGVNEYYITGGASDWEKFEKWAETVPYTMRSPLYHWTHLELKRYFGIDDLLNIENAKEVYDRCNELLQQPAYSTIGLLKRMNVELICTTDDPTDGLEYHKTSNSKGGIKMLPTFRPDKLLVLDKLELSNYIDTLGNVCKIEIKTLDDLMNALRSRIQYFVDIGCFVSDHGLNQLVSESYNKEDVAQVFNAWRSGGKFMSIEDLQRFRSFILHELALVYHENKMVMQLHVGAIRNNNDRLLRTVGADVGCDSIGDYDQAVPLSKFLNRLDSTNQLTRTILYNLNPRDNEVFASMVGNFQDGSVKGKIQWGSAWWFLDQKDGMEKQLNTLSNMGLLSHFLGMLTDSRSFLSFPRHEYFRRVLCNLIGEDIEKGLLPNDIERLGKMVSDICYYNSKKYFNIN